MEAKLSIEIGADVSKLTQGMANAANVVASGASKIDKSTISLQRNLNNLNKTPFTFGQNFQRQSQIAANGVNQLDNAVKKSRSNMQAWMYIIQDAPFGLMGIQNNLTQLIPGVGAASLAFSALISALTFSQVGMTYWNKGAKSTAEATKTLSDEVSEYIGTLDSLQTAQLKASESYDKDVAALNRLYNASQNTSLSLTERKKAVDALQATYPAYFKNVKDETILNGGAKSSYDRLTASIIAKAKAQAYADEIASESKTLRENRKVIDVLNDEIQSLRDEEARINKRMSDAGAQQGQGAVFYARQLEKVQTSIAENEEKLNNIRANNIPIQGNILNLEKEISGLIGEQGVEVLGIDTKLSGVAEKYNRIKTEALDINKILKEENAEREKGLKLITAYLNKQSGADGANSRAMNDRVVSVPLEFQLVNPETVSPEEIARQIRLEELGVEFDRFAKGISSSLASGIGDIAEGIGSAFASGANVMDSLGNSVLSSFGQFLSKFGSLLINFGLAGSAFSKLQLALLNPATAPGAAVAAVAAGLALKVAAGAISGHLSGGGNSSGGYQVPKFANGVTNFSGGMALVGERGPELVSLPTGSNVITNENIRRYGVGGGSQVFIPNMRIEGQDLVVVFDRASRNRNRIT